MATIGDYRWEEDGKKNINMATCAVNSVNRANCALSRCFYAAVAWWMLLRAPCVQFEEARCNCCDVEDASFARVRWVQRDYAMSVSYARMKSCHEASSPTSLPSPMSPSTTTPTTSNALPRRAGDEEDWQMQLAFCKPRHNATIEYVNCISQTWRMKERVRTCTECSIRSRSVKLTTG